MKIVDIIQKRSNRFEKEPESSAAEGAAFQDRAIEAVLAGRLGPDGKVTKAWNDYMRLHVCNPDQLKRLNGEDEVFNRLPYARKVLAYVLGNGTCSVDTRARTFANLNQEMIVNLDKDLSSVKGGLQPLPAPFQEDPE